MIIATAMQKGGVGKTTTTLSLGSELARGRARVLLVDLDPQSNLTQGLGYEPTTLEQSIYEVLLDPARDPAFAILRGAHGVDLIPATLALAGAELAFAGRFGRELLLRSALTPLRSQYDFILIDSPPSLGLFTINALVAAEVALVPLQAHVFALSAMAQLEETVRMVQPLNPTLAIGGIVVTMVDKRTSVNGLIEQEARVRYGELVFQATDSAEYKDHRGAGGGRADRQLRAQQQRRAGLPRAGRGGTGAMAINLKEAIRARTVARGGTVFQQKPRQQPDQQRKKESPMQDLSTPAIEGAIRAATIRAGADSAPTLTPLPLDPLRARLRVAGAELAWCVERAHRLAPAERAALLSEVETIAEQLAALRAALGGA